LGRLEGELTDPIRVLHIADLHIGMENYGRVDSATGIHGRVLDFLRRFDEVIEYGLSHEVDLVIFAGDAFKTRDPNPTYQREFARRVKRLSDAGVPTVLLVGNHDLPAMEKKATSLDIFRTLTVPNVVVGWRDDVFRIETKRGPAQVACVPYPMRQRLLAKEEYRGKNLEELDRALTDIVGDIVRGLSAQLDPAIPAVLTGHFTVGGAVFGSERSVMIGSDVVVLKSVLADPTWDYVALGHIHKHQELNGGAYPAIVYPGSLERIDFGEERDPKGFCWVELARGATQWQFVQVKARPFVTVWADAREADDPTQVVLDEIARKDVTEAVVRVNVKLTAHQEAGLREKDITASLTHQRAGYVAAISKDIEREARARLGGATPEGLSPLELLERYFESKGTEPKRTQQLLESATKIVSEST
jgi:exonuclease SbcD